MKLKTSVSDRVARLRLFSSDTRGERSRRPTDLLLLICAAGLLLVTAAPSSWMRSVNEGLTAFIEASPGLFGWFWELSHDALLVWPVVLLVAALLQGRLRLFRDEVVAVVASFVVGSFVMDQGSVGAALLKDGPPAASPAVRLALGVAVIATASPHLTLPFKRLGHWVVGLGVLATIALQVALPLGLLLGLAIGLGAAAVVHLIFGSPGGRPSLEDVSAALGELGVGAGSLTYRGLEPLGAATFHAEDETGPLWIRVLGRDAWGGQFIVRVWDALWYRGAASGGSAGRLQQVERLAFLSLLAERSGVPVQPVLAAGRTGSGDALLVTRDVGKPVEEADASVFTDAFLDALWEAQAGLGAQMVAHGALDGDHIVVTEAGTPALQDFSLASPGAPRALVLRDQAQLLATTALLAGQERAVATALGARGADGLAELLPYLQRPALTPWLRSRLGDGTINELREGAAAAASVEPPKLERLRRVTIGSVVMAVVVLLMVYVLMTAIAGVGIDTLAQVLAEADQGWIWAALILGIVAQLGQAFSSIGASIVPIRYTASFALQLAVQFISVAVPSSAARVTLLIRFFQRNGASTPAAMTIGAIDAVSGFLIQAVVVLVVLISGAFSLDLRLDDLTGSGDGGSASLLSWIIVVGVVVFVVGMAAGLTIPKYRRMLMEKASSAREQLRVLRSPRKVLMLFGGNLAGQLFLAAALGACLRAMGQELPLAQLLFINTLVALFSGVMPVPGGMGVTEAATATFLTAAGVPSEIALSAAIVYRLMTFYIPPLWGGFAMRWLRANELL